MFPRSVWIVFFSASALVAGAADSAVVFRELGRKQVVLGDHKVTYVRVLPPKLPVLPAPAVHVPSAEELAVAAGRESKQFVALTFSATVYPGPVTEIRWRYGDRQLVAYSNVDFALLTQTFEVETADAVISIFGVIGSCDAGGAKFALPEGVKFSGTAAEYIVDCSEAEMRDLKEAFVGLDALHGYVEAHRSELILAAAKRAELQAQAEAAAKAQSSQPRDIIVRLWRIENPPAPDTSSK